MELPLENTSVNDQRAVIQFLFAKGEKPANIYRELVLVYGHTCLDESSVRRWCRAFKEGRTSIENEKRSGRPRDSFTKENIARVRELLDEDRRYTLDEIRYRMPLDVSRTTISRIIRDELGFRKLSARWVPRLLTDDHKRQRLEAAQAFFKLYRKEKDSLYDRIVTGDETWIHHFTPESKKSSMQWCAPGEPPPKKAKVQASVGKVMATVFWDAKGILLIEYMPKGKTINAEAYQKTLINLRKAIWNKRRLLAPKVLLFHDNARPHTARSTLELLKKFNWELFPHPPYSPDTAPSDYYLFPTLKRHLEGKNFTTNEELQSEVTQYFKKQPSTFYYQGISKLKTRYQKCMDRNGDYVEKWRNSKILQINFFQIFTFIFFRVIAKRVLLLVRPSYYSISTASYHSIIIYSYCCKLFQHRGC